MTCNAFFNDVLQKPSLANAIGFNNIIGAAFVSIRIKNRTGKINFKKKWGDIKYGDNWKTIAVSNQNQTENASEEETEEEAADKSEEEGAEPKYKTAFYIDKLPKNSKILDSLNIEANYARFQLGSIFKEKLKESKSKYFFISMFSRIKNKWFQRPELFILNLASLRSCCAGQYMVVKLALHHSSKNGGTIPLHTVQAPLVVV